MVVAAGALSVGGGSEAAAGWASAGGPAGQDLCTGGPVDMPDLER